MSDTVIEYATPESAAPKGALVTIFLIVFVDLLGFGLIIPLLPFYARQYGATPFAVEMLSAIFSFCQFIASPLLGMASDRFGRKPVLFLSQIGSVCGYLLLGWTTQNSWTDPRVALGLIYAARLIDGISGGNISTASAYIADVTSPKDRAKGMGIIGAAFGMGFIFGPGVGGLLGSWHPSYPAYAAALLSAIAAVMTVVTLSESRVHKPAAAEAWLNPRAFAPIFRKPVVGNLMMIWFVSMTAYTMMDASAAMFLQDVFKFNALHVGLYFAFIGCIIATVQGGLIGKLTRHVSEWILCAGGVFLVSLGAFGTLATFWKPALWLLGLGGLILAAGRSMQGPTMSSLVSQHTDSNRQGTTMGLFQGMGSLGRGFGPVLGGLAYGTTQMSHPTRPYVAAAIILLATGIWTWSVRTHATTS